MYSIKSDIIWTNILNPRMLNKNTSQNIPYAFSKIWNGNINAAGTDADKDYGKFGDSFRLGLYD